MTNTIAVDFRNAKRNPPKPVAPERRQLVVTRETETGFTVAVEYADEVKG